MPGKSMEIKTNDFVFTTSGDVFGVVVTSDDNLSLSDSKDILLIAVSRAQYFPEKRADGIFYFNPKRVKLDWLKIDLKISRPFTRWTLQPLDDAFEPLGPGQKGTQPQISLNQKVHFYRLTLNK